MEETWENLVGIMSGFVAASFQNGLREALEKFVLKPEFAVLLEKGDQNKYSQETSK